MIEFSTPHKTIQVKSSYFDLTCSEYSQILEQSDNPVFVFSILTGIPIDELIAHDLTSVADFVSFLIDEPARKLEPLDFITIDGVDHTDIDIFEDIWARKITADELIRPSKIKGQPDQYMVLDLVQLVAIYTTPQGKRFDEKKIEATRKILDSMPVAEVYPFGLHLEQQLLKINAVERKRLNLDHTPEEIKAGINRFNEVGIFCTIDMIAQGNLLKHDKVLNLPFSLVFNKLLLSNIKTKFDRRLNEVLKGQ